MKDVAADNAPDGGIGGDATVGLDVEERLGGKGVYEIRNDDGDKVSLGAELDDRQALGPARSSLCDRRLSRAAREILARDALPVLRHYIQDEKEADKGGVGKRGGSKGGRGGGVAEELWRALNKAITPTSTPPSSSRWSACPLHPSLDLFRHHELHSLEMDGSFPLSASYGAVKPIPVDGTSRAKNDDAFLARQRRRRKRYKRRIGVALHRCGLCGKKFHTRYYLDAHMDLRHSHEVGNGDGDVHVHVHVDDKALPVSSSSPSPSPSPSSKKTTAEKEMICPANVLCPALGYGECERVASDSEPYYDRGSGGTGPDASDVRRKVYASTWGWKGNQGGAGGEVEVPCDERRMEESRRQCRKMFETCFGAAEDGGKDGSGDHKATTSFSGTLSSSSSSDMIGSNRKNVSDMRSDLIRHVCDRLTCRDRLHTLAGHVHRSVHHWRHEWDANHDHSIGFIGAVVLVVLASFYFCVAIGWGPNGEIWRRRKKSRNRKTIMGKTGLAGGEGGFGELKGFKVLQQQHKKAANKKKWL